MFSQSYIIDTQICIAVLYLLYLAIMHNRIPHRIARAYLVTMIPIGLIIPLVKIPLLPAPAAVAAPVGFDFDINEIAQIASAGTQVTTRVTDYLWSIYIVGALIMFSVICVGATRLIRLLRRSKPERIKGLKVIFAQQKTSAYSVFDYIFVNVSLRKSEYLEELLAHEECHIKLCHTLDLIFMSIIRSLLWFNPIVWHTGKLLRQVHEFQVDEDVLNQGYSAKNYINLLILSEAGINPEFASPLSYSLTKKRLKMLSRRNNKTTSLRLLMAIPVIALLLSAFSLTTQAQVAEKETPSQITLSIDEDQLSTVTTPEVIINTAPEDTIKHKANKITIKGVSSNTETQKGEKINGNITIKPAFFMTGKINDNEPLFVIDGKICTKEDINDNVIDIVETVTVIKDSKATDKYGEKSKNGVVEITTKHSKGSTNNIQAIGTIILDSNKSADPKESGNDSRTIQISGIKQIENPNETISLKKTPIGVTNDMGNPLIIINGKEYPKPMSELDIPINTIKSVTVLKEAASTAIYGDRAKDGVIVIELRDSKEQPNKELSGSLKYVPDMKLKLENGPQTKPTRIKVTKVSSDKL